MDVFVAARKSELGEPEEVKQLLIKFQSPDRVLRVDKEPPKAELYQIGDKGEGRLLTVPEKLWCEEAEAVKAAAVILAAINGERGYDALRRELIDQIFELHEKAVLTLSIGN